MIQHFERHLIIEPKQAVKFKAQLVRLNQTYIPVDHKILFFLLKESEYLIDDIGFQKALHFLSPIFHLKWVVNVVANFLIEICQTASLLPYRRLMITKTVLDHASLGRDENPKIIATHVFHLVQLKINPAPSLQLITLPDTSLEREIYGYIMEWLKGKIY